MSKWPASYPLAFLIALVSLLPLGVLVLLAQGSVQFFDSHNLHVLGTSMALVGLTTVGAVFIGLPLAIFTAYVEMPFKKLILILLSAPLALPSYIGAFSFKFAFGNGGEIETVFGLITLPVEGLWGSALVMSLYTYPFVLLTTRAKLLSLDSSLVNAARTLGLTTLSSLWFIVIPRVKNSVSAGALLAALYALSDFGTPAIMGLDTFTRVIFVEYNAFGLSQAAVLSLQLMMLVALVLFIESQIKVVKERPSQHLVIFLPHWQKCCALLTAMPIFCFAIILPLWVFGLWLVRDGAGSFDWVLAWNSAYVALIASLATVVVAMPVALAAMEGAAGRIMERVTYFGFGVPGIVMGTALIYLGLLLPVFYQTLGLLIVAYMLRFLSLAVGSIRAITESMDRKLIDAARLLGAQSKEAFWRITLPLSTRGIVAGAALVFLEVMRELPATLMLGPTGFETLATYMWRVYEAGYFGRAAVPGLIIIVLSMFGLVLMLTGERKAEFDIEKDRCR